MNHRNWVIHTLKLRIVFARFLRHFFVSYRTLVFKIDIFDKNDISLFPDTHSHGPWEVQNYL
ncbi:hypothetical protein BpHYR1_040375 [Brachionus plicatilis]|uniref:Uncharacterized protein n=1 Tax=Brachionus plicatilis TaxID=10195 RepID=A0A3M7Q3R1_BRAPC|nr:hypothetical protein BpHYR1_040375 [Brachionus plicatilis]